MKRYRAYKTELDPNNVQRTLLLRHAGVARFAYNWGLRVRNDEYAETGKSSNAIELHRKLNVLKKDEYPWMYETSKCAPQEALRDLDKAFQNFFRGCKQGARRKGFPRFKSRKRGVGGFRLTGAIKIEGARIKLPRIGWIRLKERDYLPTDAKILSVTVRERACRWFVSVQVEDETTVAENQGTVLGIDLGLKRLAVCSDGTVYENPRAYRRRESRFRALNKQLHRRLKGGSNRRKTKAKLSKLHYRVFCVRNDTLHKATSAIIKRVSAIGIESLNVSGMLKNRCLSKSVADASMSEFLRQLKYKAEWNGVRVVEADRFYPSSKTCSACGNIKKQLGLGEREYVCECCGVCIDRDLNAALNLKQLAVSSMVTAYCPVGSGSDVTQGETGGWVGTEPVSGLS